MNMTNNENENELVTYSNDQAVTNSLLVAQKFNKRHDHVLRVIRDLISTAPKIGDSSAEKSAQYYVLTDYTDESGKSNPMYIMNRDGFSLLVMGFTGKEALNFKLEFIEAFNQMEKQVKESAKQLAQAEMSRHGVQPMVEQGIGISGVLTELQEIKRLTLLGAKRVLTMNDLSLLTGLSKSHLYKKVSEKKIPHWKSDGGKLTYFEKSKVETWILKHRIKTTDELETEAANYLTTGKPGKKSISRRRVT